MTSCLFASDLHGSARRYRALAAVVERERPDAVLLGGDLLPSGWAAVREASEDEDFVSGFLAGVFRATRDRLGPAYPRVLLIPGNDDLAASLGAIATGAEEGLWEQLHMSATPLAGFVVVGYACVPPTPFALKDWERYDVSRFVEAGAVSPEEGYHSVPFSSSEIRNGTMARDLAALVADRESSRLVLLAHCPPHDTLLDRAALDGVMVDHAPVDVHVGSIAIRRVIEAHQPWLSLHGHVHESTRLTGQFADRIGSTVMLQAAHDGPELALLRFSLETPREATRELVAVS
jgi:uncharacterized protein